MKAWVQTPMLQTNKQTNKNQPSWGLVAHTCNTTYFSDEIKRIAHFEARKGKWFMRSPSQK
jgi:hypothetical protein